MPTQIVVDVYLNARKDTTSPNDGAILFSYLLDRYVPVNPKNPGKVHVSRGGDIYVKDADTKDISLTFVLQTKELVWGGEPFKTTLAPNLGLGQKAEDLLWITKMQPKPQGKWSSSRNEFDLFAFPTGVSDAIQVTMHRGEFGWTNDFPYALGVNVVDKNGKVVALVRDDPQIRDRGVPSIAQIVVYWEIAGGILGGIALAALFGFLHRKVLGARRARG